MDFERDAVESDYDEQYDSKNVVIGDGQASYVNFDQDDRHNSYLGSSLQEDVDRESLDRWASTRLSHRHRRIVPVQLPSYKAPSDVDTYEDNTVKVPLLNLPKGGWQVQQIKKPIRTEPFEVQASLATTPVAGCQHPIKGWQRPAKWKHVANDILIAENNMEEVEDKKVEILQPAKHTHTPAPRTETSRQEDDEKRQNTKICRFVEISFKKTPSGNKTVENNRCRRANCTYAHTLSKWAPRACRFQTGCRSAETCPFKHSNESLESYYERTKNMAN